MSVPSHLVNQDLRHPFPQAVGGDGVWLFDAEGRRYLDGCSGALVANCGHGVSAIARAMAAQAERLDYVYRYHFSNPAAEALAARFCHLTKVPMGRAYFVNSGSEATEAAVKLARVRHLAAGEAARCKVISRWQSYHGVTMAALSWSGFTARRADYQPYLGGGIHIPPPYCFRCWFGLSPDNCALQCAAALDDTIRCEGPETVAAFIAEPVAGSALAAACPPPRYFQAVREICDRHGVLYIAEEVMTGAGRCGGHFFASDHFGAAPDLIVFGKGVGGGYYPLAGVLVSPAVDETIAAGVGGFTAGQSHSGHPLGMAAGMAVLDFMAEQDLVARAAGQGAYLGRRLETLRAHPLVGDVRGMGLMWGLEFVADRTTRRTFDPSLQVHGKVYRAAREAGLLVLPAGGCDRGRAGDAVLLGPPLTISREEIDALIEKLAAALDRVWRDLGC